MALNVDTKSPTYDITITIDDEPVRLHIKRLSKTEVIAFRKEVAKYEPRGVAEETDAAREARQEAARLFQEACIRDYIAVESGDVVVDGESVVTGAQLVEAFYNRLDVLDALATAVYAENCMGKAQKKILNSLRRFSPGSTPSTPTPAGAGLVSTAAPVDGNASVSAAGAMVDRAERPSGNHGG
jgi:hypothetical protein